MMTIAWIRCIVRATTAGLFLLPGLAPARAAETERDSGSPAGAARYLPVLIGVSSSGAVAGSPDSLAPADSVGECLHPGLSNGVWRIWNATSGKWPADFTPAALGVDQVGAAPDYAATDALARMAAEQSADLMPTLPMESLDALGASYPGMRPLAPRAQFLYELAERYDADGEEDMPAPVASRIRFWRLPIELRDAPGGADPADLVQLAADTEAIAVGASGSNIIADLGDYSTAADPDFLRRASLFTGGVIRSSLHGAGARVVIHKPDFQSLILGFKRLRGATAGLPMWTLGLRAGESFAAGLPDGADPEQAAAAYLSAYATLSLTAAFGGGLIWDGLYEAESGAYRAPEAVRVAAERLAAELKPYFRAEFDDSQAPVYVFKFNRETEPATWIVFWDWAADPDYAPGKTRKFTLRPGADSYRAVPLVDDPPAWPETKILEASKIGVDLELGRTPLLIEKADFGRAVEFHTIIGGLGPSPFAEEPDAAPANDGGTPDNAESQTP